jgi:hypothetical protein
MADAIDSEHLQQLIDKVNEENAQLAREARRTRQRPDSAIFLTQPPVCLRVAEGFGITQNNPKTTTYY